MRSFTTTVDVEIDDWELGRYIQKLGSDQLWDLGVIKIEELEKMYAILLELKKLTNFKPYSHEAILLEKLMARYEQ